MPGDGTVILGVPLFDGDNAAGRAAFDLAPRIAALAGDDPRLALAVQLHAAPALVRAGAAGPTVVGGEIVDVQAWVADDGGGGGVTATAAALERLHGEEVV